MRKATLIAAVLSVLLATGAPAQDPQVEVGAPVAKRIAGGVLGGLAGAVLGGVAGLAVGALQQDDDYATLHYVPIPARDTAWVALFDGATLRGWEGNTAFFRVEDGALVGGIDSGPIPRNEFLCRREEYGDFEMALQFRLEQGVNSGVQFRSERIAGSNETIGYQADLGDGYWGAIYDESRRNTVLIEPAAGLVASTLEPLDWNAYRILAEGPRIRLYINGVQTVDYTEADDTVARTGKVCVQIHSGPPGEVRFREIRIRELAR